MVPLYSVTRSKSASFVTEGFLQHFKNNGMCDSCHGDCWTQLILNWLNVDWDTGTVSLPKLRGHQAVQPPCQPWMNIEGASTGPTPMVPSRADWMSLRSSSRSSPSKMWKPHLRREDRWLLVNIIWCRVRSDYITVCYRCSEVYSSCHLLSPLKKTCASTNSVSPYEPCLEEMWGIRTWKLSTEKYQQIQMLMWTGVR